MHLKHYGIFHSHLCSIKRQKQAPKTYLIDLNSSDFTHNKFNAEEERQFYFWALNYFDRQNVFIKSNKFYQILRFIS